MYNKPTPRTCVEREEGIHMPPALKKHLRKPNQTIAPRWLQIIV
jgi:hypothetical protein